jgi:hypothetical protein
MSKINKMIYKVDTPTEIKKLGLPTLDNVIEQYGQLKAEAYTQLCVVELLNYISVGDGLTKEHIERIGEYIVEDYSHLSLADVGLVLKRGQKGFYGQLYNRLDVPTVINWFAEYEKERTKNIISF